MKKLLTLSVLFALLVSISACTKKQEAPVDETTETTEIVVEETEE
jgi:hypothetical protein